MTLATAPRRLEGDLRYWPIDQIEGCFRYAVELDGFGMELLVGECVLLDFEGGVEALFREEIEIEQARLREDAAS